MPSAVAAAAMLISWRFRLVKLRVRIMYSEIMTMPGSMRRMGRIAPAYRSPNNSRMPMPPKSSYPSATTTVMNSVWRQTAEVCACASRSPAAASRG